MRDRALITSLQIAAIFIAILGGVYLGLFSCGGYYWHKQAIHAAVVLVTLAVLFARFFIHGFALWRGTGFVALVIVVFFLSEATAAPFYPAAPESFSEFWHSFIYALEYGPC